jgi:arginine/lysine/ornithine decarboxylase
MHCSVDRPVDWRDLLEERLKTGRGSAIRGQKRGRILEDFVEVVLQEIFGKDNYESRCRFRGESGLSTEKADFAICSRDDPRILIEVKAFGATGSKLTDILGDMQRIITEKRHDTDLLFITDGVSWRQRLNDLRKLVELQNRGRIQRIYTMAMEKSLRRDLEQLKREHGL